ncbi:molybdopterin molybdotransferase MoeA [Allopontixanthobacter sp.]|uniref:molybdopterin molybdotransferase MoeA n=1 Tax=Allopontixanthobacter sp. TaxID=2906452 RepID=UPI002ABC324B|nr:molybdopterin molybdotransferase MoeA [Allopontixanthobacter sp.]MDZ4306559.1 molybdopterin molybdotransferase MoeA [Allopontixanthobacter sp.]
MTPLLSLEEAQIRLLRLAEPLATEILPVGASLGRYLASPVVARRSQPPADLSSMDGYAIGGPGPWRIIGESRGGAPFSGTVRNGEAVRISTGAVLPAGCDRILIQEHAERGGDELSLTSQMPAAGQHIRRAGFDFASGETLMGAGTLIGPAQIALILASGARIVTTRHKPRVTFIDCGDELAADPENCLPHQIPASNGAMLAALAANIPCETRQIGPVPDTLSALGEAFEAAGDSDLIVTSGGASVGDHDLIRPALAEWGAEIDFWRVAIKPGKPLLVARRDRQVILGLPGNPVSSFVTGYLFMLPLLRHLSGAKEPLPLRLMCRAGRDLPATGPRREFLRAIIEGSTVTPLLEQDSSALLALARANALIERPENSGEVKAGTDVPVYLIRNG